MNLMGWLKKERRNQFLIIGLGRFGTSVARTLHNLGYDVLAVDAEEERVRRAACENIATQVLQVNATDPDALKQIGAGEFQVAVVAIGSFLQESILATLNAKEMGIAYVVAKATTPIHGAVLEKVGADRVVYPESDMGRNVALSLTSRGMLESLQLDPEHSIVEVVAPREFTGQTLRDLDLRRRFRVNVLALRHDGRFNVNPDPDDRIGAGDIIVMIGANRDLDQLPKADLTMPDHAARTRAES
ncbi:MULTISPECIES: potassium channel family protein [Gloeobacter]|uniref:Glr0516 protein n=2 Tax=Gloeobacter TaxID=33071 RepID=Q7NN95_GLOVI|nr:MULTISPECIES: NAD-binding protein [Gloeobacter]UFP95724.1 TrkA family potassium uptake protein [Gloeobacter morelensis MG652769]BAC88457.1 glr0516 [Gloeobacter violaceus PCC 7421]